METQTTTSYRTTGQQARPGDRVPVENQYEIRPATISDLEAAVGLFNACSNVMIGKSEANINDIRSEWLLPDFNLTEATRLVLTPQGRVIGYIEVWDNDAQPVKIWVWGRVHPDFEGQGIGTYLMKFAEAKARQAITRVPQGLQVVVEAGTPSHYRPAYDLFSNLDMKRIRHFLTMAIELVSQPSPPSWPEGVTVRTMRDIGELEWIIRAQRDAFKDHWGYIEQPLEEQVARWRHFIDHDDEFDPDLWFLAMDGSEIAGMSLCWPKANEDPDMGWVGTLGVRRPWRRQGLGLALLKHSFEAFVRRGKMKVGLGVDADSLTGATRLYEKAGMRPIRQFDVYRKVLRPGRDISTQSVSQKET